jgi:hypothetical protein
LVLARVDRTDAENERRVANTGMRTERLGRRVGETLRVNPVGRVRERRPAQTDVLGDELGLVHRDDRDPVDQVDHLAARGVEARHDLVAAPARHPAGVDLAGGERLEKLGALHRRPVLPQQRRERAQHKRKLRVAEVEGLPDDRCVARAKVAQLLECRAGRPDVDRVHDVKPRDVRVGVVGDLVLDTEALEPVGGVPHDPGRAALRVDVVAVCEEDALDVSGLHEPGSVAEGSVGTLARS